MCYLWGQNSPFPLKKYFFGKTYFHAPLSPIHDSKFFKNLELLPPQSEAVHRALSELKNKNLWRS